MEDNASNLNFLSHPSPVESLLTSSNHQNAPHDSRRTADMNSPGYSDEVAQEAHDLIEHAEEEAHVSFEVRVADGN